MLLVECLPFATWADQYEKQRKEKSKPQIVSLITGQGVNSCSREASRVSRNHFPSWQAVEIFASSNRANGISLH